MGKLRVRKHDLRCRNQAKSKAFLEKMNFISKGKKKSPWGGGGDAQMKVTGMLVGNFELNDHQILTAKYKWRFAQNTLSETKI